MDDDFGIVKRPIPIVVTAEVRRSTYGYFLGPCYLFYARACGVEVTGSNETEALDRLAGRLSRSALTAPASEESA